MKTFHDIRFKTVVLIIIVVIISNLHTLYTTVENSIQIQKENLENSADLLVQAQAVQAEGHYWAVDFNALENVAEGFAASPSFSRISFYDEKGSIVLERTASKGKGYPRVYRIKKELYHQGAEEKIYLGFFIYEASYKQLDDFKYNAFILALKNHSYMVLFLTILIYLVIHFIIIRPIKNIADTLVKISKGNTDVDIPYIGDKGQIGMLSSAADQFKKQSFRVLNLERSSRQEAEESNRLKDLFLARMSHELRTPLHGIKGCTQIIDKETLNKEQRRLIKTISTLVDNMTDLVGNILDFSKMKFNKIEIYTERTNLRKLISTISHIVTPLIEDNGNNLHVNVDKNLPEYLYIDDVRYKQILFNLLSNAAKFTSYGEITLSLSEMKREGDQVWVITSVTDTGIGMTQEFLNEGLMSLFTQEDESISREFGGTGLGLSIVDQLVKLMNGDLRVESIKGEGSTFTFTVPFKYEISETATEDLEDEVETTNEDSEIDMSKLNILVADDDPVNRLILKKLILNLGANVEEAADGKIAFNMHKENHYDFIFMDLMMPNLNGMEATMEIRKLTSPDKDVPIIAVTAHVKEEAKDGCLNAGMNDYLTKPFNAKDIEKMIVKYQA